MKCFLCLLSLVLALCAGAAHAQDLTAAPSDAPWYSLHFQTTAVEQGHPSFSSPMGNGPNSMKARGQSDETTDMTLFAGVKWGDLELYANPEMDQGYGVSNTLGVAGFPSGEAYKVGEREPYFRMQRLFGRYVYDLGGEMQSVEDGPNQIAGAHTANNLTFTFGKFSVVDLFDTNKYAHDPRVDFLNWSMIDMGAFDYAADAWGYTYGGAVEWTQAHTTLRAGLFDLSRVPNDKYLATDFGEYQILVEAEERHKLFDRDGTLKALFFLNGARMGSYSDALSLATRTGALPDTSLVRHFKTRMGGGLNAEQSLTEDLGAFLRASLNDGTQESYEFTEVNRSLSGGVSLKGTLWNRGDDTVGLGGAWNGISGDPRRYFAAGGLGILIGDGQLPSYVGEEILEAYYRAALCAGVSLTGDYQHIANPAYNALRGPIDFFALRAHLEF